MIFAKKPVEAEEDPTPTIAASIVFVHDQSTSLAEIENLAAELQPSEYCAVEMSDFSSISAKVFVLLDLSAEQCQSVYQQAVGEPSFIIASRLRSLQKLGQTLERLAKESLLQKTRLLLIDNIDQAASQFRQLFQPVSGPNIIKMPTSPEVDGSDVQFFYAFSPELRSVIEKIASLAENNIERIFLLGAPGAGKTSLAYYYYLFRKQGNFVAVNLNAENTGDKTAMKSLICGHVLGAIPGAQTREGALSFARDGVCFLDESHGLSGAVMQVLMEVLDSGQFLPFGGTVKRKLECAVVFASNRSWDTLRAQMPIDEHARLGATVVTVPDLAVRQEDIIAIAAITLARFADKCSSWQAPEGLTAAAWQSIENCQWHGNARTLIRTIETASVETASSKENLIAEDQIATALELWEGEDREEIFISVR